VQKKPTKVTAIEIMTLVAGIFGISIGFAVMWSTVFLYVAYVYAYVFGILAIVIGAKMLSSPGYTNGEPPDPLPKPPHWIAVMAIINIICCDFMSLIMGILILVFLADEEVKAYYSGQWRPPPPVVPVYAPPPGQPPYPGAPPPQGPPPAAPPQQGPPPDAGGPTQ